MTDVCAQLKASDVVVSLFIDAQKDQIDAAKQCEVQSNTVCP
jgi:pyridoxine 5-phosphate synthase